MRKRAPIIEWHITESDADWERLQASPLSERVPSPNRRRLQPYFWGVGVLLLLLVGVGDWWWRTAQAGSPPTTAEVTATAQPKEEAAAPDGDSLVASVIGDLTATEARPLVIQAERSLRVALQNNAPAAYVDIVVRTVEVWGEEAVAHVVTHAESGAPAYRQTRFYRRTTVGWQQTAPDAALWGPERSLATQFFSFRFRQHDASAVIAVAPQVDTLYTTMRHNFGLPFPPGDEKLVIQVSVTQSPGTARFLPRNYERFVMQDRWVVASPAIYLAPVELSDADLLVQSIALPLLEQVVAQASEQDQIGLIWHPILNGLHLWQLWDLDLPLAAWREEVVQWLYLDLPTSRYRQTIVLPERYAALCAMHRLWLPAPAQLEIPLVCSELDRADWFFSAGHPPDPLTHLDQLAMPAPQGWFRERFPADAPPGQAVALATLIEYAVDTYGRERLPALVTGLGQYESWETLLPAVYGVSPSQFEAGWQAYLAERYAVSLP